MAFMTALAAAAFLWAPAPLAADVKDATPGGFTVENTVHVPVDAATAWKALVDDVDAWWPADHTWWGAGGVLTIDPHAGGCFCERRGDEEAQHLQVVFVEPPKLLRMTGGLGPLQGMGLHGVLEFRLAAADGGTAITLFYRAGGYTPDDLTQLAPIVDQVQALQIGGLAAHLAKPPSAPGTR